MSQFGERLKALREARKLSADALGRAAGMREGAIYKLERGDSKEPEFTNGVRLARALGVTPEMLAGLDLPMQPASGRPELGGEEPRLLQEVTNLTETVLASMKMIAALAAAVGLPQVEQSASELLRRHDPQ